MNRNMTIAGIAAFLTAQYGVAAPSVEKAAGNGRLAEPVLPQPDHTFEVREAHALVPRYSTPEKGTAGDGGTGR